MKIEKIDNIVFMSGTHENWNEVIEIGHKMCKEPDVENVVCDVNYVEKEIELTEFKEKGVVYETDIVIIGAGVTGAGIARELSKYNCQILLVEKCEDISEGTTKANNGMIHSGYDSKPSTLKAKLNVKGNAMYTKWAEELGFKFYRTGSFVCGFNDEDKEAIIKLYENGLENKVPEIEIITGDRARELEPDISKEVTWALWTPTAGYVEPYDVTLALAENAVDNGTKILLDCQVMGFEKIDNSIKYVITTKGLIKCNHVINAAGLYADEIAKQAGDRFYSIHARRGTLVIFDRKCKSKLSTFVGTVPRNFTKGGGPNMTPDGTLLMGPSAKEIFDKDDLSVEKTDLDEILKKGQRLVNNVDKSEIITYFAGNRAATFNEDFIICNSKKINNFTHVAGIQSPGLASAPAIAELTVSLVLEKHNYSKKENFNPIVKHKTPFRDLPIKEKGGATIVCRCEMVTEEEIIKAIHGKIPAKTVDAIKRRTRACMGRCQGGFCSSKIVGILAKELNIPITEVTLKGKGSNILIQETRTPANNQDVQKEGSGFCE